MEFPVKLIPDTDTRAGRMLAAGDVRVTVTNKESGEHITVRFKAILDNRTDGSGNRPIPESKKNWVRSPLSNATHVFMEVPSASGDFPDKIGTFYPKTGKFYADKLADPERVSAAIMIAQWLTESENDELPLEYRFQEESFCGHCGKALTDPVSIDRGIDPECYRQQTGSQHQVKHKQRTIMVDKVIADLLTMSEVEQQQVQRELEMWLSK